MSVLRKRVKHYGRLPSATIRDPSLGDRAIGLLLRIVDLPDNWVVRADTLAAGRPQGRDATAAALRNLASSGYYRVERRKMRNGRFQMGTAISEDKMLEWIEEYKEFEGKPIPLVEQPDGSFRVRRKDGSLRSDGFVGEFAPGAQDLPMPGESAGHTGNGKSGSGQDDHDELDSETDISGHGFAGSNAPASGLGGPISNYTEKCDREVPAGGDAGDQLPLEGWEEDQLRAVGASTSVPRERPKTPTANRQDQSGGKRPKLPPVNTKDPLRGEAWRLATLLPRRYRDGLPAELRFPMANVLTAALTSNLGPAAILRYAELFHHNAAYAHDRHLPLLRAALLTLRADAKAGLVCRLCGTERADPFGPPCELCRPVEHVLDHQEMTAAELEELQRARAFLGAPPADPDAAFDDALAALDRGDPVEDPVTAPPTTAPTTAAPNSARAALNGTQDVEDPPPGPIDPPPAYAGRTGDYSDARGAGDTSDESERHDASEVIT